MASGQFPKSPNKIDPVVPSAVASRASLVWEGREKRAETKRIIDNTAEYIKSYVQHKMPGEIKDRVDIMAGIEDKIYNYINQSYINMFNRYTVTVEDEFMKKVRDFVDKEELKSLARYTPKDIVEILDKLGGTDKFNTGEIEKSVVNMYGHLQGHIQRGVNDLENETNSILRQKTDVGMFVRGENAYSIVKCAFKDNDNKPKTVTDVKLSINILDSELISPIFHYQTTVEFLLKDTMAVHLLNLINREIENLKEELVDQGKPEITDNEVIFEKINRITNYTDDDTSNPNSRRYRIMAKKFMDKIEGLRAEIDQEEFDSLGIRENIKAIIDSENIRNRGFNTAVNALTSILDTSKLGYQVCDNKKNARDVYIREYEDENRDNLPDERYSIRLTYLDQTQIKVLKKSYDTQVVAFMREVQYVWDVVHTLYEKNKKKKLVDFNDLARKLMDKKWQTFRQKELSDADVIQWDHLGFRPSLNSYVEKNNRTYTIEFRNITGKINYMRKKLETMFGFQNPVERVVIDERINFLDKQFSRFSYEVNPHHVQPGLLLDVDVTTVKKKQYMLKQMANVLNEFLSGVSKGFADAAFASFKRRRSTVKDESLSKFGDEESSIKKSGAGVQHSSSSVGYTGGGESEGAAVGVSASVSMSSQNSQIEGMANLTPGSGSEDRLKDLGLKEL
jgi:hypothetical protein